MCYTHNREVDKMPTNNPRVNVVLERPLYETLRRVAKRDGVSLSLKVRDLVREALEASEDVVLDELAQERERSFDRAKALAHKEVWGGMKRRRARR
ncbi:MAG: antitoxin, RHH family protein [Candidatus Binatia bacterium]